MLKGVNKLLTGDLLKLLCDMGHGDELVIADANFPADACAKRLIRLPGIDGTMAAEAILSVFPLDTYSVPAALMDLTDGDKAKELPEPAIWSRYENMLDAMEGREIKVDLMERYAFYERAKNAYAIIQTGEERQYGLLDEPVLQWRYAAPETASIPEEGAVQNALDFLKAEYGMDCSACRVSAVLYTGNANHIEPFADPFWVVAFYNETADREAEVWVNANTGATPKHRAEDVEAVVREQFAEALEEGYEIGGRLVTEDMIDDVAVMYLETEEEWYGVVTVEDTYWEIQIDADTLEPLDTSRSNG